MRSTKKGNPVTQLYRQYGAVIYARCRRMLKDDALAEDATQEVFIRVMRAVENAPAEQVLPWIHRITTNYCLNLIRDRRHDPEVMDTLPEMPGQSPEAALLDKQLAERLVGRAPSRERLPVVLCYRDGLEHQQIAEKLGISRRTVVNRLNEFLARARGVVAEEALAGAEC